MKATYSLIALVTLFTSSALAAPPGPYLNWTSPTGSVLTLTTGTTGSYFDNDGIGNCPKGNTYQLSGMTQDASGNISFKSPLCYAPGQAGLIFQGKIQTDPSLPLNVSWTFTAKFSAKNQTWTSPIPSGPPCPSGPAGCQPPGGL